MSAAHTFDGRHVNDPETQPRSRPRHERGRRPPADPPTDGDDGPSLRWIVAAVVGAVVVLGVGLWWIIGADGGGGRLGDEVRVPVAPAYAAGEEAFVLHPTVSDAAFADAVAETVEGAPALVEPSLADVPAEATAEVYVFANGLEGAGWLGHQRNVVPSVPSEAVHRSLREIVLVTWNDADAARAVTSAEQVAAAKADGAVSTERTGVIANTRVLLWPTRTP